MLSNCKKDVMENKDIHNTFLFKYGFIKLDSFMISNPVLHKKNNKNNVSKSEFSVIVWLISAARIILRHVKVVNLQCLKIITAAVMVQTLLPPRIFFGLVESLTDADVPPFIWAA